MGRRKRVAGSVLTALIMCTGCSPREEGISRTPAEPGGEAMSALERDTRFDAALLAIASEYKRYNRVSDRANWSPTDCRIPPPVGVQVSASGDEATHGRKLYYVFAKDDRAYFELREPDRRMSPVGQAVVKEAFKPVAVPPDQVPALERTDFGHQALPDGYARTAEGVVFHIGEPAGLYIMMKMELGTACTDEGWVYAVTSPDAKSILTAGNIESCRGCHERTKRDRLFGPRK